MALDLSDCDISDDLSPSPADVGRTLSDAMSQSYDQRTTSSSVDGFLLQPRRWDRSVAKPTNIAQVVPTNDL
jgi:hypothetical protein